MQKSEYAGWDSGMYLTMIASALSCPGVICQPPQIKLARDFLIPGLSELNIDDSRLGTYQLF